MYKQFSIAGADVYLVTSTLIFMALILVVSYRVYKMSKKEVEELEKLPLE